MSARGVQAAVWVLGPLLAISMLSGLGFYAIAGVDYAAPNDDTNRVLEVLEEPSGSAAAGQGVVESFTAGAADGLQVFWILVTDTSEVVMLFIPFPPIANALETLARIAMGLTVALFLRGVVF